MVTPSCTTKWMFSVCRTASERRSRSSTTCMTYKFDEYAGHDARWRSCRQVHKWAGKTIRMGKRYSTKSTLKKQHGWPWRLHGVVWGHEFVSQHKVSGTSSITAAAAAAATLGDGVGPNGRSPSAPCTRCPSRTSPFQECPAS